MGATQSPSGSQGSYRLPRHPLSHSHAPAPPPTFALAATSNPIPPLRYVYAIHEQPDYCGSCLHGLEPRSKEESSFFFCDDALDSRQDAWNIVGRRDPEDRYWVTGSRMGGWAWASG